jgi:hypothetical protein
MKRNPMIDTQSVKTETTQAFVKVSYDYKGLPAGVPSHHVNYYIAHGGRWIDVHLSMTDDIAESGVISRFDKSLGFYTPTPVAEKVAPAVVPKTDG